MRILVLGGAGFLGSVLIERLSKNRANIIQVFDTFSHGFPRKPPKRKNILPPISGNIRNYYDVVRTMEKFRPEVVVHLAAFNSRPETLGDFRTCAEINYLGTANVAQACLALRTEVKKVVFSSTLAAESPVSHYGVSKRAAEDLLQGVFSRFPEGSRALIVLRFSEIYGNSVSYTSTSLVNFLVDGMIQNHALGLYGTDKRIDCVHITDAVRACELSIAHRPDSNNLLVDVGSGQGIVVKDLVRKVKAFSGYEGRLSFLDSPAVPFQSLVADPSPAKRVLGFEAKASLDVEIEALIKIRRKALR